MFGKLVFLDQWYIFTFLDPDEFQRVTKHKWMKGRRSQAWTGLSRKKWRVRQSSRQLSKGEWFMSWGWLSSQTSQTPYKMLKLVSDCKNRKKRQSYPDVSQKISFLGEGQCMILFQAGHVQDSIYQIGKEVDWWAADLAASYCSDLLRF